MTKMVIQGSRKAFPLQEDEVTGEIPWKHQSPYYKLCSCY